MDGVLGRGCLRCWARCRKGGLDARREVGIRDGWVAGGKFEECDRGRDIEIILCYRIPYRYRIYKFTPEDSPRNRFRFRGSWIQQPTQPSYFQTSNPHTTPNPTHNPKKYGKDSSAPSPESQAVPHQRAKPNSPATTRSKSHRPETHSHSAQDARPRIPTRSLGSRLWMQKTIFLKAGCAPGSSWRRPGFCCSPRSASWCRLGRYRTTGVGISCLT